MPNRTQRRLRVFLLVMGGLVTLTFAVWPLYARRVLRPARERDYATAEIREGTAVVAIKQDAGIPAPAMSSKPPMNKVFVRINGRILEARNYADYEFLREGQTAHVTYRVGKSGTLYVDTVRPLLPDRK